MFQINRSCQFVVLKMKENDIVLNKPLNKRFTYMKLNVSNKEMITFKAQDNQIFLSLFS